MASPTKPRTATYGGGIDRRSGRRIKAKRVA